MMKINDSLKLRQMIAVIGLTILTILTMQNALAKELPTDSLCCDFDVLVRYLVETHPDPFSNFGGEHEFYSEAERLKSNMRSDSITSVNEFGKRANAFLSRLHDGHTWLNYNSRNNKELTGFIPLKFRPLADGLVVRETAPAYKELLGLELVSINGIDVPELTRRMSTLAAAENQAGELTNLFYHANDEYYLKAMGLDTAAGKVDLGYRKPNGEVGSVAIPIVPSDEMRAIDFTKLQSSVDLPTENFSFCFLDNGKTGYFKFSSVMSRDNFEYMRTNKWNYQSDLQTYYRMAGKAMPASLDAAIDSLPVAAEVFFDMLQEMKQRGSDNLIIDLRGNGGGWTPIVYPMLYQLFGKEMIGINNSGTVTRKISPLYLQKNNLTLEGFNQRHNGNYKLGELVTMASPTNNNEVPDSLLPDYISSHMMTCRPDLLISQNGDPVYRPENIYVLTDGRTFSAAFHTAFYLRKLGAKIVGAASSQAPNTYMEATPFKLPVTELAGSISNSVQEFLPSDDPRAKQFTPDIVLDIPTFQKLGQDTNAEILLIRKQK